MLKRLGRGAPMRRQLGFAMLVLSFAVGCTQPAGQTDTSRGNGSSAALANGGDGYDDGYGDGYGNDPNDPYGNGGYDDPSDPYGNGTSEPTVDPASNGCNWPNDPYDLELTTVEAI